jgi:hypothetical protein
LDGLVAQVQLRVGDPRLTAVITADAWAPEGSGRRCDRHLGYPATVLAEPQVDNALR